MLRNRSTPRWLGWLLVIPLVFAGAGIAEADSFDDAKRAYRAFLKRASLYKRFHGRLTFARTKDPRALRILMKSYGKTEDPKAQVRYLLASICKNQFSSMDHVPAFDAWRTKNTKNRDAWLWYKSLQVRMAGDGATGVLEVARTHANPWLRAAAVEVLADDWRRRNALYDKKEKSKGTAELEREKEDAKKDAKKGAKSKGKDPRPPREGPPVLALFEPMLAALPPEPAARTAVLGSLASALLARAHARATETFRASAAALIKRLDDDATPAGAKLVLARHFAKLFGTDILGLNAAPWLRELDAGGTSSSAGEGYAKGPTFIGIRGTGDRICYAIDLSDSMLTPLTTKEKGALGPVTGGGRKPTKRGKKRGKKGGPLADPKSIPWDQVKNRFEAARELLKLSLAGLAEDKTFCVILFGRNAERMKATPGLMRATPSRIRKTIRELDALEAGGPAPRRPHGTLMGQTNVHGAIHRAFKLKKKGLVKTEEYVDPVTYAEGCDTLFILSDGAPTWDDWAALDKTDPGDRAGDPEAGTRSARTPPQLNFYGPYAFPKWLVDDVRRLNLFRKMEIHCVGIGEARMRLLRRIAALGLGKTKKVGTGPKK
jgi:hypothetical protein